MYQSPLSNAKKSPDCRMNLPVGEFYFLSIKKYSLTMLQTSNMGKERTSDITPTFDLGAKF